MPERLARFAAAEWPGAACPHEALWMWVDACTAWLAADSELVPKAGCDEHAQQCWLAGGSRRSLPFGEHGDALDVLREHGRYSEQIPPCPHEARPAQHWVRGTP